MGDGSDGPDVRVVESETAPAESVEWDLSVTASARLTGPRGTLRIDRRYHGLPRHNDVVDPDAADSNDELLDGPDELYVHSKYYLVGDGRADDYFLDRHETWRPDDPDAIADESAFLAACEAHHLADLAAEYDAAMDER